MQKYKETTNTDTVLSAEDLKKWHNCHSGSVSLTVWIFSSGKKKLSRESFRETELGKQIQPLLYPSDIHPPEPLGKTQSLLLLLSAPTAKSPAGES